MVLRDEAATGGTRGDSRYRGLTSLPSGPFGRLKNAGCSCPVK